jgi:hypothetical protein
MPRIQELGCGGIEEKYTTIPMLPIGIRYFYIKGVFDGVL